MKVTGSVCLAALALVGCAGAREIPYIDAHSHLVPDLNPDEEVARFRASGLKAVVIMNPDPAAMRDIGKRHGDFVIPFISIARLPEMAGIRLSPGAAAAMGAAQAEGAVCGFGEVPTRVVPATEPSDDLALLNLDRLPIYALADARGLPLNIHVTIDTPAVEAAVDRVSRGHPRMKLILAHAGWSAGPEVLGRLMAANPNLYADLSIRLDPAAGFVQPRETSILAADGSLLPEWRVLIERFPDRFMFGMDITGTERPAYIDRLIAVARQAFAPLPRKLQHALAHGNIEALLAGCAFPKR
ncbi:amidohydrolase family protein [Sphingomonas sp. G-3-2-10]|uniref:amidohydrolase family protein n=1 Tax=Sphingomonas sp. G-3-2-10 TaxID=2728838 RepID=UPI00146B349D|nr:amidohydrolase family protein [Sphingomonas sp. G-3-2-10]NML08281.1 amidohydrolase family protein [Sphingomonas sp. G-3-2-10]